MLMIPSPLQAKWNPSESRTLKSRKTGQNQKDDEEKLVQGTTTHLPEVTMQPGPLEASSNEQFPREYKV